MLYGAVYRSNAAYIAMACMVMTCAAMAYEYGYGIYSYGRPDSACCRSSLAVAEDSTVCAPRARTDCYATLCGTTLRHLPPAAAASTSSRCSVRPDRL